MSKKLKCNDAIQHANDEQLPQTEATEIAEATIGDGGDVVEVNDPPVEGSVEN